MVVSLEAEAAVRNYLTFLDDPSKLVDRQQIADLEHLITSTTDPIERLRLFAQLEELQHPIEAPYREAFVEHAREWGGSNGIPAPAFLRMGVPKKVLDAAGFKTSPTVSARAGGQRPVRAEAIELSRRVVRADEVRDAILRQRGQFSLQTIQAASGASPMTVRKALKALMAEDAVVRLGPDPEWTNAGRAPVLYTLTQVAGSESST